MKRATLVLALIALAFASSAMANEALTAVAEAGEATSRFLADRPVGQDRERRYW
jgi:hypothetical protein